MAKRKLATITREEFDRRLDAYNAKQNEELQQMEAEQARVNKLLTQWEADLERFEAEFRTIAQDAVPHPLDA